MPKKPMITKAVMEEPKERMAGSGLWDTSCNNDKSGNVVVEWKCVLVAQKESLERSTFNWEKRIMQRVLMLLKEMLGRSTSEVPKTDRKKRE